MEVKVTRKTEHSDELKHWKYVKKKKVNGKWRYYYDIKDALGYDERAKAAKSIREYNKAAKAEVDYSKTREDPTRAKYYDANEYEQLTQRRVSAGKAASKAIEEYYKTPIGKLDRFDDAIDSGRNIVAKILEKASNKIRAKSEKDFHLKY